MPIVDCCEIEAKLVKKFPTWGNSDPLPVCEIPFQMFAYRVVEIKKATPRHRDSSGSGSDGSSSCWDENTVTDEFFSSPSVNEKKRNSSLEMSVKRGGSAVNYTPA